eukprot:c21935_g1_i1 orf=415-1104(+)
MAPGNAQNAIELTGSRPNQRNDRYGAIIPIIKIVRISAPKLVRIDAANFRALVQEMTGANGNTKEMDNPKSSTQASNENISQDILEANVRLRVSKARPCHAEHRDGITPYGNIVSGAPSLLQGAATVSRKKREDDRGNRSSSKAYHFDDGDDDGVCDSHGSPILWESSCAASLTNDHLSDIFFAADSDPPAGTCVDDDPVYIQQRNCGAYLDHYDQQLQLDIPGGFDHF